MAKFLYCLKKIKKTVKMSKFGENKKKFSLLMWKNVYLTKRKWMRYLCEVLIPILLCILLLLIRIITERKVHEEQHYEKVPVQKFMKPINIAFSPKNKIIEQILTQTNAYQIVEPFNTAELMEQYLGNNDSFKYGLQFDRKYVDEKYTIFDDLTIIIRGKGEWYTDFMYDTLQQSGPRDFLSHTGGKPSYLERGFLLIQYLTTEAFIKHSKAEAIPNLAIQRFPYPAFSIDEFYDYKLFAILIIIISYCYGFINIVRALTAEKEKQLKESMKIMGLPGWLLWVAWFLRALITFLASTVVIIVLFKIPIDGYTVCIKTSPFILLLFLLIYGCANVCFAFFISTFFSKSNKAAVIGGIVYFISFIPYTIESNYEGKVSVSNKLLTSLLPNTGLARGINIIWYLEGIEAGANFGNLFTSISNYACLGYILLMLLFDIILYMCLTLYVDAIFPGDFGLPQKWYFPFTKTYWLGESKNETESRTLIRNNLIDKTTENLPTGIQIKNLSKTFGSNTVVKHLDLDMYEGQITVLLGHNGAGKTTTMSMITGMIPPSGGTVIVSGYDVRQNTAKVRDSMGICLQHNVLFDDLTVSEHLYFFGKLKGLGNHQIKNEINRYLKLLNLENKRHALSSSLSGGMKRKLSVGIAMCGNSKVVMLDEPTAGMDPAARRDVWELLQKEKRNRTILLTTHYMDEADLLGDRIAIMTDGSLKCVGSSFFLKKIYGDGYYLIMDIAPECSTKGVTSFLQKHISSLEIESRIGSELSYLLLKEDVGKFEKMLADLESNSKSLGINSYGISLPTMEKVFMKIGADHLNQKTQYASKEVKIALEESVKTPLLTGTNKLKNQFLATIVKKETLIRRNYKSLLIVIIIPLAILLLASIKGGPSGNIKELVMNYDGYDEPVTIIQKGNNSNNPLYKIYKDSLKNYQFLETDNIRTKMMDLTIEDPLNVKIHYIVGASFEKTETGQDEVIAWFNGDPLHSNALSVSFALNAIYKNALGDSSSIKFVNHPLPRSLMQKTVLKIFVPIMTSIYFAFILSFLSSFYIVLCIQERISKFKHLQFVSGMNKIIYWLATFLMDFCTFALACIPIVIAIMILQMEGYATNGQKCRIILLLICFILFVLPFIYCCSFFIGSSAKGFIKILSIGSITSIIGVIIVTVLEIPAFEKACIAYPLHWVLLFSPFYSASKGIADIGLTWIKADFCNNIKKNFPNIDCAIQEEYYTFSPPGIGRNIVVSILMSIVLFAIIILLEYRYLTEALVYILNFKKQTKLPKNLEEDVEQENIKIRTTPIKVLTNENMLVLKDLSKMYGRLLAVNYICLSVKPYECFGLLGVNGAGKTTTFKMMTGDEFITSGEVYVNGIRLKGNLKNVQKYIGYCPQFDALLDDLTARETLRHFALIRGVPSWECKSLGEYLALEFDFFQHLDKKVNELSGGNKRKLSTALAMIGDPPIIYLDEPSAGMDPATKHYLWQALCKLRDNGKCIVLTTHSMEECEALCTRIAIMVNGSFQCLGSTQRLKNKFAQGYALTIKLKKHPEDGTLDQEVEEIDRFVKEKFSGAVLKEKHQLLMTYNLADNGMKGSQMFGILERNRDKLKIEDYSLGQCSLEQVFLKFSDNEEQN